MLSAKQGNINTIFWVFSMTQPGTEPQSPDDWWTLYRLQIIHLQIISIKTGFGIK